MLERTVWLQTATRLVLPVAWYRRALPVLLAVPEGTDRSGAGSLLP